MKKVMVYFLLFIFTLQSTKSLWIIASFEINREYIASKICINRFDKIPTCKGQCFLQKELNKEQKENKKSLASSEKHSLFIAPDFSEMKAAPFLSIISKNNFSFHRETKYPAFPLSFENPPELA